MDNLTALRRALEIEVEAALCNGDRRVEIDLAAVVATTEALTRLEAILRAADLGGA